jgi:hypothetical protein
LTQRRRAAADYAFVLDWATARQPRRGVERCNDPFSLDLEIFALAAAVMRVVRR